jgi:uncharacterized protein (DUF1778 family)
MANVRIELRVPPEQAEIIAEAAKRKGLPVATWLRVVALEAAEKQKAATT